MFVQVIHAKANNKDAIGEELENWQKEVMPGAEGFLGSTGGVTPDGQLVLVARFDSEDVARRNSDRPEQGRWFESLSRHLDGEASFFESSQVAMGGQGGSDTAGFVQVMHGRVNDVQAAKELDARMEDDMGSRRPDVIGSLTAYDDGGEFWSVIYFTSLEEARQGEKKMTEDPPPQMEEWSSLMEGELEFYDLEEPWLVSR